MRRRSTGIGSGMSRPTRPGEEWLVYNGTRMSGQRHVGGRGGGGERRGSGPGVPGRDALHRDPAGGVERQGPPAGHGPGPHRPGRAVPDHAAGVAERDRRGLRRGPGPGLQRLVLGPRAGGRGAAVRGRAPSRRCTTPTTWSGWRRRSAGSRICPGWCRCSCAPTRRSSGGRSTTRSTTRSGRPRPTPGCPSRCTRSSPPTCPGRARGLRLGRPRSPDGSYVDDFDPDRTHHDRRAARAPRARARARFSPRRSPTRWM